MQEDDAEIPSPSPLDMIAKSDDYKDAAAVVVIKAPHIASPSVRINATISDQMLKRIDRYAAKQCLTRSGFLVWAAKKKMAVR